MITRVDPCLRFAREGRFETQTCLKARLVRAESRQENLSTAARTRIQAGFGLGLLSVGVTLLRRNDRLGTRMWPQPSGSTGSTHALRQDAARVAWHNHPLLELSATICRDCTR